MIHHHAEAVMGTVVRFELRGEGSAEAAASATDQARRWLHWVDATSCAVVALEEGAVATSGTYQRGCHVIDPHGHQPARALAAVTVLGPGPLPVDLTKRDLPDLCVKGIG